MVFLTFTPDKKKVFSIEMTSSYEEAVQIYLYGVPTTTSGPRPSHRKLPFFIH